MHCVSHYCVQCGLDTQDVLTAKDGTRYVPAVLHKTIEGVEHKIHRICASTLFDKQLDREPEGVHPDDTSRLPFKCPIPWCLEPISFTDAVRAYGIGQEGLALCIKNTRQFRSSTSQTKDTYIQMSTDSNFCIIL